MTPDEKLDSLCCKVDELHSLVIEVRADVKTRNTLCEAAHKVVDGRLDGLHKKIEGNGKPGLKDDVSALKDSLSDMKTDFAKVQTRMAVYAGLGVFVGGAIVTLAAAYLGGH